MEAKTNRPAEPHEHDAARILFDALGRRATEVSRFPTGLAHFVYDVATDDDDRVVVRLTRPQQKREFEGAMYWHERLVPLGVPLPTVYYSDTSGARHGFPVMIMERLRGRDLGDVYSSLSANQKRTLANTMVAIQRAVGSMRRAQGFGEAHSYQDPLSLSWDEIVMAHLDRSRLRITAAGVVDPRLIDRLEAQMPRFESYFRAVKPGAFLEDTTTKNVIVDDGQLSGIVDVDVVCFGDPIRTPALTRMALLSQQAETDYIDFWTSALALSDEQRAVFDFYTATYCADFLAQIGHAFNRASAPPVNMAWLERLRYVFDSLMLTK